MNHLKERLESGVMHHGRLLWMGDPSSLFSHSGRPFLSQVAYKQATLPTRALRRTCSRSVWYIEK